MIITLHQTVGFQSRHRFRLLRGRAFSSHTTRVRNLEILGLPENASVNEIKAAYLRLCKEFHPDVNQSPLATEQFQKIKTAFDQLHGERYGNGSASSSTERDDSFSPEKKSREFEAWKAKQKRTRDFDDWLRKVQHQGRNQRVKKSSSTDEEFSANGFKTNFSQAKSEPDFSQSSQKFYNWRGDEEKSPEPDNSYRTEAYLRYETNFIARLDSLLGLQKKMNPEFSVNDHHRKKNNLHFLAPYIFRVVLRTVVYVSLVVAVLSSVLGCEIYYNSISSQPPVREEYQESLKKKSGTLEDI